MASQAAVKPLPSVPVAFGDANRLGDHATLSDFLERVSELSPFLKDCISKEETFTQDLFAQGFDKSLDEICERTSTLGTRLETEADVMSGLRVAKRQTALLCGLADLGGWWKDEEVTQALSRFASAAVAAAIDFLLLEQHRAEKIELFAPTSPQLESGLIVLGMGKLGAGELNYSSDIDLILFFDDTAKIKLNTDDPITMWARVARQLIKVMQERTGDGYVFRTDLRLRPDPSSTPLVIGVDAALNYYEGQGQNWERSAMIKANPIAGDLDTGNRFLSALSPFIWRKYLDFAAINDVHSIKRQIHAHKGHGEIAVYGHNIKLGRGGIREIEFFAQTQQLIAGGRNTDLRERETIAALNALAEHGWIEQTTAQELGKAYWFLRELEHRLQMKRDEQTHVLPDSKEELAAIAEMFGEPNLKTFEKQISSTLQLVETHYAALFEAEPDLSAIDGNLVFTGDSDDPETIKTLKEMGYKRPEFVIKFVKNWHVGKVPALYATQAKELLTELTPHLLDTFSKTHSPDGTLEAFDQFLAGLPAGIQLFAILKNNPEISNLLVRILDAAPRLAEIISRRPHVFDGMLEPGKGEEVFSRDLLESDFDRSLMLARDTEAKLDVARRIGAETRFQIGTRFFSGLDNWEECSRNYSRLAEAAIASMFKSVREEFEGVHGRLENSSVSILAMGRLGSSELTATSDLDLIFLYDAEDLTSQSDGERPLDPTVYYFRLMKRFITAMTAPTSEGVLYPVDFRLRPSGNAGPLATSAKAFFKYQKNEAWMWEAQALTRARAIFGDATLIDRVHSEVDLVLQAAAEKFEMKKDIREMRAVIEKEKGSSDPWELKTVSGGLLDLEFLAQWFAIATSQSAETRRSTKALLSHPEFSKVSGVDGERLVSAFNTFSELMQLERVCVGQNFSKDDVPAGLDTMISNRLDLPSLAACEAHLSEMQADVRKSFNQVFSPS